MLLYFDGEMICTYKVMFIVCSYESFCVCVTDPKSKSKEDGFGKRRNVVKGLERRLFSHHACKIYNEIESKHRAANVFT